MNMPLTIVATPIGNPEDITLRAKSILEKAEVVIGEEAKPTRKLLKSVGVPPQKPIELLNEHSDAPRIEELLRALQLKGCGLGVRLWNAGVL
jgi:16S rRNA (cytidine1402-2'-O)-methyltransferase